MMRGEIDVRRLIVMASVLVAALGVCLVLLQVEPVLTAESLRLSDDRDALRSDEVAFASLPQLERDRRLLAERYARAPGNAGAQFLRALSGIARRRGVRVVSTSFKEEAERTGASPAAPADPDLRFFSSDDLTVTLRGTYAAVLRSIADLSAGPEIVRIDAPNLTRDADAVRATIPISILEPTP